MDDRAFDLKLDALVQNRGVMAGGSPLRDLLLPAVPFDWSEQALQSCQASVNTFPRDVVLEPSCLIEPVQFWAFPQPPLPTPGPHEEARAMAGLLVGSSQKLGVTVLRFLRFKAHDGREAGPLLAGAATWRWGQQSSDAMLYMPMGVLPVEGTEDDHKRVCINLLAFAVAGQFWLRSNVAARSTQLLSRGARRRARRAQLPERDIQVITLRHAEPSGSAADHAAHEFCCRWLVRPHWRQQYLPSTGGHRPTLIAEHVKGPADKPLVRRERYYKVDR